MENRRPRSEVAAVMLHNTHNDQEEWIPTRYERWSWVRLNPGRNGTWAREARRHGGESMRDLTRLKLWTSGSSLMGAGPFPTSWKWRPCWLDMLTIGIKCF